MQLSFEIKDNLGWIFLDNPPYNSLSQPVFADKNLLTEFLSDPKLKGIIVRGKGRHFSNGADPDSFAELFANPTELEDKLNQAKKLLRIISSATLPTVAVITGSCLGAGLEIALSCHFRFAAKSAMLGFPETGHRLLPGLGGSVSGGKVISQNHLIDLILTGRMIRAEEGLGMGIVDTVGPAKEIEAMAIRYLASLTANHSIELIRTVMQSIQNSRNLPEREALIEESKLFCKLTQNLARQKQD